MCLKVMIVCRTKLILPAVKKAIKANEGEVVGIGTNLDYVSINRHIRRKKADILVLEIEEADPTYLLVSKVNHENPSTRIIIITNNCVITEETIKVEAVSAIITINETVDELVEAIFLAKYCCKYYSPEVNQRNCTVLTPRERQTLKLLKKGFSKKQIAKLLGVNIDTIRTHSRNINTKLETQF